MMRNSLSGAHWKNCTLAPVFLAGMSSLRPTAPTGRPGMIPGTGRVSGACRRRRAFLMTAMKGRDMATDLFAASRMKWDI